MEAALQEEEEVHHCQFTIDRLKRGPDQKFYDIQDGSIVYEDGTFEGSNAIRWEDNLHNPATNGLSKHLETL